MPFGHKTQGIFQFCYNFTPSCYVYSIREIPSLHFKFIQKEFMKATNYPKEINLISNINRDPLVKVKGSVSHLNNFNCNIQKSTFNDQTSFIINLQNGLLSNQLNLSTLLGYSIEPKTLVDVKKMCQDNHLSYVEHICKTYIEYCQKHFLLHENSSLSLTFKVQKSDGSFIKILCQVSICESHENELTKLLIKLTDINFISSDCDLAWAMHSDSENKLKFKKLIAAEYITIFSKRELDIVNLICTGISNPQIGEKLFISNHTVATHRKNIFRKSSCSSAASLFSYCKQRGLI